MKWTRDKIAEWSAKTFPGLTEAQQQDKADIEAEEFLSAVRLPARLEEMADFYIVQAILAHRFNSPAALLTCCLIQAADKGDILSAVDVKMDINAKRTWALINGEYRHVD